MESESEIPNVNFDAPESIIAENERQFYESFAFDDPDDLFVTFKEKDFIGGDFQKKSPRFDSFDLMPW